MKTNLNLDKHYWENRYQQAQTGWDAGRITTPIKDYVDQLTDKSMTILIPGCGNAHEAAYLWQQGFKPVHICDWAIAPLETFASEYPDFPKDQLHHVNFFELELAGIDLILEQTFFCALNPSLRPQYAQKMASLLKKGGRLAGVFFNKNMIRTIDEPPYGGTAEEYQTYFEPLFEQVHIQACKNSISPRRGNELFVELVK